MRTPAIVALGIAAYLAFLVATIPASVLVHSLRQPGALDLDGARGTLWNGSARATIAAPGAVLELRALRWRWLPARLAGGRLAFEVEAEAPGIEGRLELARGLGGVGLRDVHAQAQAASLAQIAPILGAWRPEGTLTLSAPSIAWDARGASGDARLEWRDAALALSAVRPLGSYRIDAHGEGGPAKLAVSTLDGPLRIEGRGVLAASGAWSFTGSARGPQALAPLLERIGPPRPDGAHAIAWHGP